MRYFVSCLQYKRTSLETRCRRKYGRRHHWQIESCTCSRRGDCCKRTACPIEHRICMDGCAAERNRAPWQCTYSSKERHAQVLGKIPSKRLALAQARLRSARECRRFPKAIKLHGSADHSAQHQRLAQWHLHCYASPTMLQRNYRRCTVNHC